jgi:hypothetical protein
MTYAQATGVWRRRAAYRGTQDGTQHSKRHPGGTEFCVDWLAFLAPAEAANVCTSPIGLLGLLAKAHRGIIRCCY